MNDDYKKGYADAMGWKTQNHLEHWPSAAIGKETLQDAIERERAVGYREGHMAALSQRTWVGLTDAEVKKIVGSDRYTDLLLEVVNFVEAKLKEKNCG